MPKPALGRGLGALLGSKPVRPPSPPVSPTVQAAPVTESSPEGVQLIALDDIQPRSQQPRKSFADEALGELAASIKEQGILQPLVVRRQAQGFEIIAGERRWRASRLAGLTRVPVMIKQVDDATALELALVENLQRENLNPIEEAKGFAQLVEQFGLTQDEAAQRVGKSRAAVANALRLLRLTPDLQVLVRDGRLSVGHAKVILGLSDTESQQLAAEKVIKLAINVRQTEALVASLQRGTSTKKPSAQSKDPAVRPDAHRESIQIRLQEKLGTRVELRYRKGKGSLNIHFFTDEDLERLLEILEIPVD